MTLKDLFASLQKTNHTTFVGDTGYFDQVVWGPAAALEDEKGRIGITVPIKTVKTGLDQMILGKKHTTYGMITLFQRYDNDKGYIVECNSHKAVFSTKGDYARVVGEGGHRNEEAERICALYRDLLDGKPVEGRSEGYFSWVTTMLTEDEVKNLLAKKAEMKKKVSGMSPAEFDKYIDELDQAEQA